jgi:alcohol dehydrogenase (cytochrome c)
VHEHNGFNMVYLTDPDPRGSMGLGGKTVYGLGSLGDFLTAIDYKTGRVTWRHAFPGGGSGGLLATAGGLIFAGDGSGNFTAVNAGSGAPLWHSRIGNPSNAPQTHLVDGRQHVLVAVGDALYDFVLN